MTDEPNSLPLIGIGFSPDDPGTLYKLLQMIPQDSGFAYAIAPSPSQDKHDDFLAGLQKASPLPVVMVTEETRLQPDHLYVSPPDTFMDCSPDSLLPVAMPSGPEKNAPIDSFFRCQASQKLDKAVGIILSGSGSDGTLGVRSIRAKGGLTIAQTPWECTIDKMPVSALQSGLIDVVLPLDKIMKFCRDFLNIQPRLAKSKGRRQKDQMNMDVKSIRALIQGRLGYDITLYNREVLLKSIERRMRFHLTDQVHQYLEILHRVPEEIQSLADEVMMGYGDFFQPSRHFQRLNEEVIPAIFSKKKPGDSIRLWVNGCATGEHAYALAMLLNDYAISREEHYSIQVFATDLHDQSLKVARSGRFPLNIRQDVSPEQLNRFFDRKSDGFSVKKFLREAIVFSPHELFRDPPFSHLDLIYCNDLFSRLEPEGQNKALSIFNFALSPGGFLLQDFGEGKLNNGFFKPLKENDIHILENSGLDKRSKNISFPEPGPPRRRKSGVPKPSQTPEKSHAEILKQQISSLLLNDDLMILHISGKGGRFLTYTSGTPDSMLMKMILPELKPALRLLIKKLNDQQASSAELSSPPIPLTLDGEAQQVVVKASQIFWEKEKFYLVQFETKPPAQPDKTSGTLPGEGHTTSEDEGNYLRTLLSDYEAKESRLRTVNEELATSNEELQVTMDELSVSNEEYRSMVEELRTTHEENQLYVSELSNVNNDLYNLMVSTELAVLFLDNQMRVKRFTPKVQELFNLKDQDLGRNILDQTHHLNYTELAEDAEAVFKTLTPRQREVTGTGGREYLARVTPYRSSENKIDGVVFSFTDISDTKEKERMKLQVDTAQQLAALKDEFISTVSHEIRTPLNAILNLGKLLLQKNPRKNQLKLLNSLHFSAQGLLRLVNDLLDFSKLEAGKMELEQINYYPSELLESLKQAQKPATDEKGIRLKFELDPEVPPVLVGDSYKLTQVLNNLLSNAIKFTHEGEVKLSIGLKHREDTSAILDISVSDTGIGIPEEKQKHIFEKFTQADSTTMRRFGGTGLGLSISKSLLELMGSEIRMKSKEGVGTTFYFQLQQDVGTDTADADVADNFPEAQEIRNIMHNARILLVEDSGINRMIVQNFLQDWWDVQADEANNGKEAVTKAHEATYDLILMDFRMPEMDGKEATRRIRRLNPYYASVPILALTADVQAAKDKETDRLFDGLVGKPFEVEVLQNTILSLMLPDESVAKAVVKEDAPKSPQPPGQDHLVPDLAHAEKAFEGNDAQTQRFYEIAVKSMERFRAEINQNFQEGNVKALSDAIHKQKLLLSMFRLETLYEALREQRDHLKEGKKPEEMQSTLTQIDKTLEEITEMFKTRLQEVVE